MGSQAGVEVARFRFTCRRCQAVWCSQYRVRRWQDEEGTQFEMYEQNGRVVPSPRSGVACPACGALRVTVDTSVGVVPPPPLVPPPPPTVPARGPRRPREHRFP